MYEFLFPLFLYIIRNTPCNVVTSSKIEIETETCDAYLTSIICAYIFNYFTIFIFVGIESIIVRFPALNLELRLAPRNV